MLTEFLKISDRIWVLPVIHGSGDYALEVRRVMLEQSFDCLAVPLPPSFQEPVETAITQLPAVTAVVQPEYSPLSWERPDEDEADLEASYVPVDPCQPVIAALRIALQEHMPRAFIDLETDDYIGMGSVFPDPYALKRVSPDHFAAAVLPSLPEIAEGQPGDRVVYLANRLRALETRFESILFVCSIMDWPWIKGAYFDGREATVIQPDVNEASIYGVSVDTLLFLLGELPFITGLYERARVELEDDENLSIDGIKELLLTTRDVYKEELGNRARRITPKLLATYFQYVRNLSLVECRMTPDLYTLIIGAKQIFGDQFAVKLAETARKYPYVRNLPFETFEMGIERARLPDGEMVRMKTRLPGPTFSWRSCDLQPAAEKTQKEKWEMSWNPFRHCSWPPEDVAIERFRTHVKDAALALMGHDLARHEKFTTSLKDGLDIRETLRNWHTGDLYVKVLPPSTGNLDCVVMIFDSPADPRDYPWRVTWFAESQDESTLSLFATDYQQEMVGPGIGMSVYGGAMFLFPPRSIPDIWQDRRFDYCDTLEERLIAAGCHHSEEKHIALLSPAPPGLGWKRLARRYGKKLIHIPLSRFSQSMIQQLRMFHVLNGQEVRSYAAHFIRKA
jgi:hypothetical protein